MSKKKSAVESNQMTLTYHLAGLPSSQHRAGLAGLVMVIQWMEKQKKIKGLCSLENLDDDGITLSLDREGLQSLLDEIYAASVEEESRAQPLKNKNKEIIPPLREEEITDPKTGKTKTFYVYPVVIPRGSYLVSCDPTVQNDNGLWIKLWRNMIWSIMRGVPATRKPFEDRAKGNASEDSVKIWKDLSQPEGYTVDLPSTYFLGAQAMNAETVPFLDLARFQFLLHFWPFAAQIYIPTVIDREGKREFKGFAIAIPDISRLESFCEALPPILKRRGKELSGYRPRDSIVSILIESALDICARLNEQIKQQEGSHSTADLVFGIDVVHLEKQGNNVRFLSASRLEPELKMVEEYTQWRDMLWDSHFRRQILLNLTNNKPWYFGFDSLLSILPYEQCLESKTFQHDAREILKPKREESMSESAMIQEESSAASADSHTHEALIYRLVSIYLTRKLSGKYKLEWDQVKGNPAKERDYSEKKEKLAKEAFLAIRSRTDSDFVEYFVSTLCSVPQFLGQKSFTELAKALYEETEKIRTLTMLAISAQKGSTTKKNQENDNA
jgi:CRISPR-associated protein Cmx8